MPLEARHGVESVRSESLALLYDRSGFLTVKLRGRAWAQAALTSTEALKSRRARRDRRRGRTLSSRARGAKQTTRHGPLQRLLEDAFIEATVRARSPERKPALHAIRLSAPPGTEQSHGRCSINDYLLRRASRSQAEVLRARTRQRQTKGLRLGSQLSRLSPLSQTLVRTLTLIRRPIRRVVTRRFGLV